MPRKFRPSMRSHRTIAILTVVSILCYIWAENSRVTIRSPYYDDMLGASEWMVAAMDTLRSHQYARGVFADEVNDPNLTTLIGQQYTQITTDIGDLEAKWTALNPNMAGVMVNYFKQAGLEPGDIVAAGMSGSLPGMNLAFYAAAQQMELKPVVITSVGASSWGANDPNFTWLDIEHVLMENNLLTYRSIAASMGGGEDLGRRLSPEGRELIQEAIHRNDVIFVEEPTLEGSIQRRLGIYREYAGGDPVDMYVNIGGALSSIGDSRNVDENMIPVGISKPLPSRNYPRRGAIHEFSDLGIPVLNITNIYTLADRFALPWTPTPLPEPGSGLLFSERRYNLWITALALVIVLATLIIVLLFDRRTQRLDRPGVDPDTMV
ncbi:poly-gamma-glutamate system protein [bacterium]|nr:poly-gamma-glutamate system protein [bacterium]